MSQEGSLRFPGYYPAMRKPCRENCIRLFTCVAEFGEQRSRMVKKMIENDGSFWNFVWI